MAAAHILTEADRDLMLISAEGTVIRTDWKSVAQCGRATQGVRLMNIPNGDKVVAATTMLGDDEDDVADVALIAAEDDE